VREEHGPASSYADVASQRRPPNAFHTRPRRLRNRASRICDQVRVARNTRLQVRAGVTRQGTCVPLEGVLVMIKELLSLLPPLPPQTQEHWPAWYYATAMAAQDEARFKGESGMGGEECVCV
jgi:hypothetical protein